MKLQILKLIQIQQRGRKSPSKEVILVLKGTTKMNLKRKVRKGEEEKCEERERSGQKIVQTNGKVQG